MVRTHIYLYNTTHSGKYLRPMQAFTINVAGLAKHCIENLVGFLCLCLDLVNPFFKFLEVVLHVRSYQRSSQIF